MGAKWPLLIRNLVTSNGQIGIVVVTKSYASVTDVVIDTGIKLFVRGD